MPNTTNDTSSLVDYLNEHHPKLLEKAAFPLEQFKNLYNGELTDVGIWFDEHNHIVIIFDNEEGTRFSIGSYGKRCRSVMRIKYTTCYDKKDLDTNLKLIAEYM